MATWVVRNTVNGKTLCKVNGKTTDMVENLSANVTSENLATFDSSAEATVAMTAYCLLNGFSIGNYTNIDATPPGA